MSLKSKLHTYLDSHKIQVMGTENEVITKVPDEKTKSILIKSLDQTSKNNSRILGLIIFVAIVVIGFMVTSTFLFDSGELQNIINIVTGTSILGMFSYLRSLWKEKTTLDILLAIIPSLSPEQVLPIVSDTYKGLYG